MVAGNEGISINAGDGPQAIDLAIDAPIRSRTTEGIFKTGAGTVRLKGDNKGHAGTTRIEDGTLFVQGDQQSCLVLLNKGTLTGKGPVGAVIAKTGTLAPCRRTLTLLECERRALGRRHKCARHAASGTVGYCHGHHPTGAHHVG